MDIILYLLSIIQYLYQQNCWLINLICRYIPLKQWAFDDSHSPKYQKFRVDQLPKVQIIHHEWDWRLLIPYFEHRYHVKIKPVSRRKECDIPQDCSCPSCGAPQPYLYRNNGKAGQLKCKVCNTNFSPDENRFAKQFTLRCPHCGKALVAKKERKHFILHKCVNPKCPYYLHNLKKVDKADLNEDYGKNKYKLHYIYREFTIDFFRMDLNTLPRYASSLKFSKHNAHVMSLCLTLHINLGLSLRKTRQALKDLYNINISHQQIANYCKTAAICVKPFVDQYPYRKGKALIADETYIKVRGIKTYVWLIMNAACRSIIGYQDPTIGASVPVSLPCAWHSGDSQSFRNTLSSSPTATALILWPPWNSRRNLGKTLPSRLLRCLDLPTTMPFPKNTVHSNRSWNG